MLALRATELTPEKESKKLVNPTKDLLGGEGTSHGKEVQRHREKDTVNENLSSPIGEECVVPTSDLSRDLDFQTLKV